MNTVAKLKIELTDAQVFWLFKLLNGVLNGHDPGPMIRSYEAILRKLQKWQQ